MIGFASRDDGDDLMSAPARNPHRGTSLEDFLHEEGIREEATVAAVKRVIAWQLRQEMEKEADQDRHGAADGDQSHPA